MVNCLAEMVKQTQKKKKATHAGNDQYDGVFACKLALYLLLGTLWIKVGSESGFHVPIPAGLLVGLLFTAHEHFKIDRKIEYAVLFIAALIGLWAPFGIYITF